MDDCIQAYEERLMISKSLLMAIPGRVAGRVEDASEAEIRALIDAEIDGVIAAASGSPT